MRARTLLVWWVPFRSSQKSSCRITWLRWPVAFLTVSLYKPHRSHWGSSHLPSLSIEYGSICVRAKFAPGRQRHWDLLCSYLFPHICWMYDHICAPLIETINHPCRLVSFNLNWDNSCSDIKGWRPPCSHVFSLDSLGLYDHIVWQLHIMKQKFYVDVICHILGNLKLISLL